MPSPAVSQALFAELKAIFAPYAPRLIVKVDQPDHYLLVAPPGAKYDKELVAGMVRIGKSYVSFHLMPVYMFPDLLDGISPALRARMQGKSCFNFRTSDPQLLKELTRLTKRSFSRMKQEKVVK